MITIIVILNLIFMTLLVIYLKASKGEAQIFGYQLKTVFSGSMEPTFLTGSVIAIKQLKADERGTLKKGDVITFQTSKKLLVTHRIVGVTSKENNVQYETKGDHNKTADTDLVPSQNVVGQYSGFTIPYIGYILDFAQSKKGTSLLLIVSGILLLGFAIFTFFQVMRELEKKTKSIETNENTI